MTVVPGQKGTAGIEEVPDPGKQDGALLVRGIGVGICGTDREIAEGADGTPPSGEARLVIGHESLGEVLERPAGSGFRARRSGRRDRAPSRSGAVPRLSAGQWDMCRNDQLRRTRHRPPPRVRSEQWRVEPDFALAIPPGLGALGVLLEPTSVLAKAWDQVDRISRRAFFVADGRWSPAPGRSGCWLPVRGTTRV